MLKLVLTVFVFAGNLCVFVACSEALWLSQLNSARGWDMGNGLVLKLNETENKTSGSVLDRVALDVSYGNLGMMVKKAETEAVKLDLYVKDPDVQGRGKKDEKNNNVLPLIIGYKTATMMALVIGTLKLLSLKALFIAKISLLITIIIFLVKLKNDHKPEYVEIDHHGGYSNHAPSFAEYHPPSGGFHSVPDGRDLGYFGYNSNFVAGTDTESGYSTLESSTAATISDVGGHQQVQQENENRRNGYGGASRKKFRPEGVHLTIKKYTKEEARGNIR